MKRLRVEVYVLIWSLLYPWGRIVIFFEDAWIVAKLVLTLLSVFSLSTVLRSFSEQEFNVCLILNPPSLGIVLVACELDIDSITVSSLAFSACNERFYVNLCLLLLLHSSLAKDLFPAQLVWRKSLG